VKKTKKKDGEVGRAAAVRVGCSQPSRSLGDLSSGEARASSAWPKGIWKRIDHLARGSIGDWQRPDDPVPPVIDRERHLP
jgi:hypothetical protein